MSIDHLDAKPYCTAWCTVRCTVPRMSLPDQLSCSTACGRCASPAPSHAQETPLSPRRVAVYHPCESHMHMAVFPLASFTPQSRCRCCVLTTRRTTTTTAGAAGLAEDRWVETQDALLGRRHLLTGWDGASLWEETKTVKPYRRTVPAGRSLGLRQHRQGPEAHDVVRCNALPHHAVIACAASTCPWDLEGLLTCSNAVTA